MKKLLKSIEKIADGECTCTDDQRIGLDNTFCLACTAASGLNRIYGDLRYIHEDLKKMDQPSTEKGLSEKNLMNLNYQIKCGKRKKEIDIILEEKKIGHKWMYHSLFVPINQIPLTIKTLNENGY